MAEARTCEMGATLAPLNLGREMNYVHWFYGNIKLLLDFFNVKQQNGDYRKSIFCFWFDDELSNHSS
jgi:hypothetical protein